MLANEKKGPDPTPLPPFEKWFPRCPNKPEVAKHLQDFYRHNRAYCDMISGGNKPDHPQVRLLDMLVTRGGKYAEIGCGCGAVCSYMAEKAMTIGFDISPLALSKARDAVAGTMASVLCADAGNLPLPDNVVDGSYAFEVLEHLWDPVAVVKEMIRITKPGGFILLSMPNRFSMDLHLRKQKAARCLDISCAACRHVYNKVTGTVFQNLTPQLDSSVYPDCDMISAIVPGNLACLIERMGCAIDFWDTTYMCAHREGFDATLGFQRATAHPFYRHFGDHILILAHKK